MFPTTRANISTVTTILSTLVKGENGIASSGTSGSTSSLPFYASMPSELVDRVITTDLDTSGTSTISTSGLTSTSAAYLANIRTRVEESITSIYANTPNISPYYHANLVVKSTNEQNNARDIIIQNLFNYDARYFLRFRANTGIGGENVYYELPTRHNYMNLPMVEVQTREHTIPAATVDDTGAGGTYRITTTVPHGVYTGMSFYSTGSSAGPSILDKKYWLADLYQTDSANNLGTDTGSKFRFAGNIGTNYLLDGTVATGSQIDGTLVGTSWIPLYYQPLRYFKVIDAGASFEFYHDYALTDKLIPGFGRFKSIDVGYHNGTDAIGPTGGIEINTSNASGSLDYTHMIFEDLPTAFQRPTTWTGNVSVMEQVSLASVNYASNQWNINAPAGYGTNTFSIYNGQLINLAQATSAGWQSVNADTRYVYLKRTGTAPHNIEMYTDAALTTLFELGREDGTVSGFSYSGGNARVTFSSATPPLIQPMSIRFQNTNTGFSQNRNANSVSGTSPYRITLDANHSFQNGQVVRRVQGNSYYVKTTGMAANEIEVYTDAALTIPFQATVNDDFGPVYFVKWISNTVWELYADSALTTPITVVISTVGFTTGDIRYADGLASKVISAPAGAYIQPLFYCRMTGYKSATLWVDAARTIPYAYRYQNGVLGTPAYASVVEGGQAAFYRLPNIGHAAGFTANAKTLSGFMTQRFWVNKINSTQVDCYADPGLSAKFTTPAIASPQATGNFLATYTTSAGTDQYRYRLDTFKTYNTGGTTYFNDSTGDGIKDTVSASWPNSNFSFYTSHYETTDMINSVLPDIITQEYNFSNSGAYYGKLRWCTANATLAALDTIQGPTYYDPATYGGQDTGPCVYRLDLPGQFQYATPFLVGIERGADVVVTVSGADDLALANTAPEWDSINNMIDRAAREWPNTTNPTSVTWTIDQPNQTLESRNATRFVRASDVTQYRIRYVYPPMTREDIKPYLDVVHAARGGYKPFKLYMPVGTGGDEITSDDSLTIRYWDRASNTYVARVLRVREAAGGGTKLLKVDGAPINLNKTVGNVSLGTTYVFGKGHAVAGRHEYDDNAPDFNSSLGSWMLPIHEVESNSYGEINIRLNNGVPGDYPIGTRLFRDGGYLNVFLDGNTVEIKVDVLGYHYMEVEFITKKIF